MRDPALDLLERQWRSTGISHLCGSIFEPETRHSVFLWDYFEFVTLEFWVQEGMIWRETRHHDE